MNVTKSFNLITFLLLICTVAFGVGAGPLFSQDCTSDPILQGFRDFYFKTGGVSTEPTEFDPESKLWYNDGMWWSVLWDPASEVHRIYRFDLESQCWSGEGPVLDERPRSSADVLWDGQKLYVTSHARLTHKEEHGPEDARLYRYSYNSASKSYSLDGGFPVIINNTRSLALSITKDSTGQLWATWDGLDQKVYINRTLGNDLTWGTPFVMPGLGDLGLTDFVSSIISFGGDKIGVMWGNPLEKIVYFSEHHDSSSDLSWESKEVALSEPGKPAADNHINLAAHPDGTVFAAVKTRFFEGNDPVIYLLKRTPGGVWSRHVFGRRAEQHNRPMVMIDVEHDSVYVFAKNDNGWPRGIYMKRASVANPQFDEGIGTPFILSASDSIINNPTSTKQNVTAETGLLVLAGSKNTNHYMHNFRDLSGLAPSISSFFPTSGQAGTEVTLSGSNFTGATAVKFGAVGAAGYTIDSDNQIRAVFPASGETGKILVINTHGVGVSTDEFISENDGLTLLSPNGGESWAGNTVQTILWDHTGIITDVKLEYSVDNGASWTTIVGTTANDGSYAWNVADVQSTNALIRISDAADGDPADISDGSFTIDSSSSPGGDMEIIINTDDEYELWVNNVFVGSDNQWDVAQTYTVPVITGENVVAIHGINGGGPGALIAQVSVDSQLVLVTDGSWKRNGSEVAGWNQIGFDDGGWQQAIAHGAYGTVEPWYSNIINFPVNSPANWIWNEDIRSAELEWYFRGSFTGSGSSVPVPEITSFSPDNGEAGTEVTIFGNNLLGTTGVQFNGVTADSFIVDTANQVRAFVAPGATTGQIALSSTGGTTVSTEDFIIAIDPVLTLTNPLGGEFWLIGSLELISWSSEGPVDAVKLEYSSNNGATWTTIVDQTPNDGAYDWSVDGFESDEYLIRISDAFNASVSDVSNPFSVTASEEQEFPSQAVEVGYQDFVFGEGVNDAPSAEKPQSKLWWNDGKWWGVLWNPVSGAYRIHRFSVSNQSWTNTGPDVDEAGDRLVDVLWDGQKLYVITHHTSASGTNPTRLYRYSYNFATDRYSLDAGFPVDINLEGAEAMTLAKDSTGQLWISWESGGKIWINRSLGDDLTWGTSFALPVQGTDVKSDDISAILSFGGNKIGVFWSNQNDQSAYFAIHRDSNPDQSWESRETALFDPSLGPVMDDHMNLKTDDLGNVYAVTKTVLAPELDPNLFFLVRNPGGTWSRYVVSLEREELTRPVLLLDEENREGYIFAMNFKGSPQAVYMKKTDLDNPSFVEGLGTPFIQSNQNSKINNPTSTKQNLNSATGLLVLATHSSTTTYYHNYLSLNGTGGSGNSPEISSFDPGNGPGGTLVTITGSHFAQTTAVYFNGVPASGFVVDSDSQLRATVPSDATTGKISVSNPSGTAFSTTDFIIDQQVSGDMMDIVINTDDEYNLWVNGSLVGSDNQWDQAQSYRVPIIGGKNVVAVHGINGGGPGALIAEVRVNGELALATGGSWRRSAGAVSGWNQVAFDDSGWQFAVDHGVYGTNTWGTNINGFPLNSPAHWIWSEDIRDEQLVWYFRGSFEVATSVPTPEITGVSPDSGTAGSEVLITGNNLTNVTDVQFNGVSSLNFIADTSEVRATVPVGASTGQISVFTLGGTAVSPAAFTVLEEYPLNFSVVGSGSVVLDPAGGSYLAGTQVSLTPQAASGWVFSSWSGDLDGFDNPATITMDGAKSVTATFIELSEGTTTISFSPSDDAQIKLTSPENNYGDKTVTKVEAAIFDSYLKFNVTGIDSQIVGATLRMYAVNGGPDKGSVYLVSNNYQDTTDPWDETGLTGANAPGITGSPLSGGGVVVADEFVEFDVTAAVTSNGIFSFGITGNSPDQVEYETKEGLHPPKLLVEVSSEGKPAEYDLTVGSEGSGTVALDPDGGSYEAGSIVGLTATAEAGWEFSGWSGDLSGSVNPESMLMDRDKNVTAIFTQLPHYDLTVRVTGSGTVSVDPVGGNYLAGTEVALTPQPAAGWKFVQWTGDLTGISDPATVTMDSNVTVTAEFAELGAGSLILTSPNGAEAWQQGTVHIIEWQSDGPVGNLLRIEQSFDNGESWSVLADSVDNDGSHSWAVPEEESDSCLVRLIALSDESITDQSDGVFSIIPQPVIELGDMEVVINADDLYELWVNGEFIGTNDQWDVAQIYTVPLQAGENVIAVHGTNLGFPGAVIVEVRVDGEVVLVSDSSWRRFGSEVSGWFDKDFDDSGWLSAVSHGVYGSDPWGLDIANFPTNSQAHWIWGDVLREDYREWYLRGSFEQSIPEPNPEIVAFDPDSGFAGDEVTLQGNHFNNVTLVRFNGEAAEFTVNSPNQIETTVPQGASSGKIEVVAAAGSATSGQSFEVLVPPSLTLLTPNGGENWYKNSVATISWSSEGSVGTVDLEYSLDNGASWLEIAAATSNDGSHAWTIPDLESESCLIRVMDSSDHTVSDTSDAVFSITEQPEEPLRDMEIVINCDDEYELWVNGEFIGSDTHWDLAQTYTVPLRPGRNVLAVHGTNTGFPGALIAEVKVDGQVVLVTDSGWRRSGGEASGWTETEFDDAGWQPAIDHGQYGIAPWNTSISGFPSNSIARWIWGEVLREDYREWYMRGDFTLGPGKKAVDGLQNEDISFGSPVPSSFELFQNYPNPFNPSTTIAYALPEAGPVILRIFDVNGREVKTLVDQVSQAGRFVVEWHGIGTNGKRVPAGIYFYRMSSMGYIETKKLVLLP